MEKDFDHIHQLIERCESGEIKYIVQDRINQFKKYFQFVYDKDENDPDLTKMYPPQQINFSDELPDGFSNDKTIRFSSSTYLREFMVYEASSLNKELLLEYIEWIKEKAETQDSFNYTDIMSEYPLLKFFQKEELFMSDFLNQVSHQWAEFWHHHDGFKDDLIQRFLNGEKLGLLDLNTIVTAYEYKDPISGELISYDYWKDVISSEANFYAICSNNSVEKIDDWFDIGT